LSKVNSDQGEIMPLGSDDGDTGHFEHLPLNLGRIRSIDTMLKMYTVPGGEPFNKTRQMVLKDVDGVVFVVDSDPEQLDANILSLQNLEENLAKRNISLFDLPVVIQYNKRDLEGALPIEKLEGSLNPYGWPLIESSVTKGKNVKKTLTQVTQLIYEQTASKYSLVPSMAPAMVLEEESQEPEPILEEPTELELKEDDLEEQTNNVKRVPPPPSKLSRSLAAHLIKSVPPPPVLRNSSLPTPKNQPAHSQATGIDLEPLLNELESRLLKRMDILEVCMQHVDKKHDKLAAEFQKFQESIDLLITKVNL
jgi:signal recognition particle receptor subunit beta